MSLSRTFVPPQTPQQQLHPVLNVRVPDGGQTCRTAAIDATAVTKIDERLLRSNASRVKHEWKVGQWAHVKNLHESEHKARPVCGPKRRIVQVHTNDTVSVQIRPGVVEHYNIRRLKPLLDLQNSGFPLQRFSPVCLRLELSFLRSVPIQGANFFSSGLPVVVLRLGECAKRHGSGSPFSGFPQIGSPSLVPLFLGFIVRSSSGFP